LINKAGVKKFAACNESHHKTTRAANNELYESIKEHLEEAFTQKFGNCHLEITAGGVFSNTLKSVVRHHIMFSFLGKRTSPDLTGFIHTQSSDTVVPLTPSIVKEFITVQVKRGKITLQDIYQAKMYGDLFPAKYALLLSSEPIPENIVRLDQRIFLTYRSMRGWYLYIGEWHSRSNAIGEIWLWLPHSPFQD